MVSTETSGRSRRRLQADEANCRVVGPDEYCSLLLGFTRLVRADDPTTGMCGLHDAQTGITYLVDGHQLAKHTLHMHA
ncbi:hypothetical protein [Aeoliella sp.]|uniref:hypothetical protein n=1 Tax=Aeoliella sp. TaxID=2795800 RepID=UPI003CCBE346